MFKLMRRRREAWADYVERVEAGGLRTVDGGAADLDEPDHGHAGLYTVRGGELPLWVQDLVGDRPVSGPEAPPEPPSGMQVFRQYSQDIDWSGALAVRDDFVALEHNWPTTGILQVAEKARMAGAVPALDVAFYLTDVQLFGLEVWTLVLAADTSEELVRATHARLAALPRLTPPVMVYEQNLNDDEHEWIFG